MLNSRSVPSDVPAYDQTVDSILVFNLVLSRGAQRVDRHSSFIPAHGKREENQTLIIH